MRVTKEWLKAFETVMNHHRASNPASFRADEVDECKQEARENPEWAREFYPKAAAMIEGRQ